MNNKLNKIFKYLCTFIMVIPISACNNKIVDEENDNPDTSGTHVYFGSYPQSEVVSNASDSGVYNKAWSNENDYIIDANLYNNLATLSEENWNNNETTIENNKYRRINASCTTNNTVDDANYYDWSSSETYHYFKYEPIKWRILSHSDGDTFLLSELVLDDQKFNTIITNMYWENCTLRSWLNGYDSSYNLYGTDYSNNNFIDTAFTDEEQSKIKTTTVINNDSIKHQTEAGNNTEDKVFILSEEEVYGETAITYGFDENYKTEDINRQAKSSTYAKAMGVYADIETSTLGNCDWWLRTPGSYTGLFDLVQYDGKVYRGGQHADSKTRGVRPAIHINF